MSPLCLGGAVYTSRWCHYCQPIKGIRTISVPCDRSWSYLQFLIKHLICMLCYHSSFPLDLEWDFRHRKKYILNYIFITLILFVQVSYRTRLYPNLKPRIVFVILKQQSRNYKWGIILILSLTWGGGGAQGEEHQILYPWTNFHLKYINQHSYTHIYTPDWKVAMVQLWQYDFFLFFSNIF